MLVAAKINTNALGCKKTKQVSTSDREYSSLPSNAYGGLNTRVSSESRTKTGVVWEQGEEEEQGSVSVTDRRV